MKPIVIPIAVLFTFVSLLPTGGVFAHEFETGHIERSIDVVVRGQKIQVKYSLGLADETIVDWLAREGMLEEEAEARYRKCIADLESATSNQKDESTDPDQQKKKPAATDAEPLAFQTELMQLLREKLSETVCENLQLSVDGEELGFIETSVANSARHHVAMEIVLIAELAAPSTTGLSLVDRNFLELDEMAEGQQAKSGSGAVTVSSAKTKKKHRYSGNVRLACRVKGDAIQLNSNVAPVLARAKPVDVGPLTLEERTEAATIRTKIGFVKPEAR